MKVAVFSSDAEELLPNAQVELFRLSANIEYLAVVITNKLTLFHFKLSLNHSIELESQPVQIEIVGQTLAVRSVNRRVSFHQIRVIEGKPVEVRMVKCEPSNIECDLMTADHSSKKFVLLSKNQLWIVISGNDLVSKNYAVENCKLTVLSQLAMSRPALFSNLKVTMSTGNELYSMDLPGFPSESLKMAQVPIKLANIIRMVQCQSGYMLLLDNQLEAEILTAGGSFTSKLLRTLANSNKLFPSHSIQVMNPLNRDVLVVYVEATNSVYQFELGHLVPNTEDQGFLKSVRRIKVKEKIWRFEVGCDDNTQVLMIWNEKGLKNLKIKQEGLQAIEEPKLQKKESPETLKPKKVLQRESKALKPASEPTAATIIFSETKQTTSKGPKDPEVVDQKETLSSLMKSQALPQNPFLDALIGKQSESPPKQLKIEQPPAEVPKPSQKVDYQPPNTQAPKMLPAASTPSKKERVLGSIAALFDRHIKSSEQRYIKLIDEQTSRIGHTVSNTAAISLAQILPVTVTNTLRSRLVTFLEKDFGDRLEQYFQEIFKRIGETHQQGINYVSEMHRLGKEKIDKIDQQVILHNLTRLEAVMAEIKTHLSTNPSDALKKIVAEAARKLEAVSLVLQETVRRQSELAAEESKHCDELLQRVETVRKLMGDDAPRTDRRKKYLLIRRSGD